MTLTSTLGSPGIEIREIDNSFRVNSSTATTIYVPGFASQGPVDEVMSIGTISDFETIYGVPTNAAERYFYYTVKAILDGSGAGTTILCSRLPYGNNSGDTVSDAFTMLAYPAIPVRKTQDAIANSIDFEQFIFESEAEKGKLENLFRLKAKTSPITATIPTIETFVLTIDDDFQNQDNNKITSLSIVNVDKGTKVPSIKASYYNEKGEINSEISAPTITLQDVSKATYNAVGHIAYENKEKNIVHASYTISKDTTQIGSLYIKLVYNKISDSIAGSEITGGTDEIKTKLIEVYEINTNSDNTVEYYSQKSSEDKSQITYLIGSPVMYQISLGEYYKIITGELLNWENTAGSFPAFVENFSTWSTVVAQAAGDYANFEQQVKGIRSNNPLGWNSGGIQTGFVASSAYNQSFTDEELDEMIENQRFEHDRHPQDIGDKFSIREIAMQIAQKTNISSQKSRFSDNQFDNMVSTKTKVNEIELRRF